MTWFLLAFGGYIAGHIVGYVWGFANGFHRAQAQRCKVAA
jgi:hypothetical protein